MPINRSIHKNFDFTTLKKNIIHKVKNRYYFDCYGCRQKKREVCISSHDTLPMT